MAVEDRVSIFITNGIADVRLNRPDKRNALDNEMFMALASAGERLKTDKGVRVVVLSGEGSSFCAGLDFGSFQKMAGGTKSEDAGEGNPGTMAAGRITHLGQQVSWVWQEIPVPVIAAVHGHALGGGIQICLGADIRIENGYIKARAERLKGVRLVLDTVTVTGTENLMMAATLAKGTTVINNAAREPEIVDLATCLRAMGAQIEGDGTSRIEIQGVDRLHGATHPVVTDRIELGTYMLAPVFTGGEIECIGGRMHLVEAFVEKLDAAGIEVTETALGLKVKRRGDRPRAVDVTTEPFPGFPTDLQAQMMAMLCLAEGTAVLKETIFENRFMHAPELIRMGAKIEVHGNTATVKGVAKMKGAPVMATDLRASVSLILAGLASEGETIVNRVYHLDRGYEHVEEKLSAVGAQIERVSGK